jgi:hypothetical protein
LTSLSDGNSGLVSEEELERAKEREAEAVERLREAEAKADETLEEAEDLERGDADDDSA